jgi:hypothetical protein
MAVDISPRTWLGLGYGADPVGHIIALETSQGANPALAQLLDAKADPLTGDIREVAWALNAGLYQAWVARGSANQTTQMRLSLSIGGAPAGAINYIFQSQFTVLPTGIFAFAAEP